MCFLAAVDQETPVYALQTQWPVKIKVCGVRSFRMVLILSLELITETLMQSSLSGNPLLCPALKTMMKKLHFPP